LSIKVMTWVWDKSTSKGTERLVLLAIADAASDEGDQAWPSIATISKKCGGIGERTVQRSIQRLIGSGELEVTQVGSGRRSSRYRVVMTEGRQNDTPANLTPQGGQFDAPGASNWHPRGGSSVTQPVLEPSPTRPVTTAARAAELFEQFWRIYPRKVAKGGARASFEKAIKRADPSVILAGAQRYRDDPNRSLQFTKHPSTWLNQDCWDDDPLPSRMDPREEAAQARIARRRRNPLASAL
jgi:hypothetical protein